MPENDALSIQKGIALRAYELYLQRGGVDGHAEEDWLQAEREILANQDWSDARSIVESGVKSDQVQSLKAMYAVLRRCPGAEYEHILKQSNVIWQVSA